VLGRRSGNLCRAFHHRSRPPDHQSSSASAWLSQPPSCLGQHGQFIITCSCLLMSPGVNHHDQSSRHLGPSVQASYPSTRHVSTWPSPCLSIIIVLHSYTPTQPRDMLHTHSRNG
jgi:hypothetical protein